MQTLAGVTTGGLSSEGFYIGFLLILILVVGLYVAYTGLIKRETTKAIHAVVNFVVVFVLSAAFIAYAPDYIGKINEFSADISNASLTLGTKIVLPNSESQGKDSVDLIRDSLFSIQVKQPWLLLQYGNSDVENIGADRVERLLSTSTDENNGQDREEIVVEEIEDRENTNLTITKTINRLGTVFFLFLFNIGISIFVFLLTGIIIFSQVLFIIYAMFLPVSFLLSMVPSFEGMSKRAITKLFNTILTRAGITLIITVAFSISTMLYNLSGEYPFFLTAFLQIVTFAGIYFKLGDLMGMFSLQSGDSQSMGSRIMRRPRMLMHAHMHRLQHKLGRSVAALGAGTAAYHAGKQAGSHQRTASTSSSSKRTQADHSRPDGQAAPEKESAWKRAGSAVGVVAESFARDKSGGKKVTYTNPVAVEKNGGWRYSYGNMFYVLLVSQYLTVAQFDDETMQSIMEEALKYEGWTYVYGGDSPSTSFDCSGLVQWCYGKAGIDLPRTAQEQYNVTQHIPLSESKAGDLVFFHSTYNAGTYITHVGLYVGNNRMYHAGNPIGYADLTGSYWQQHLAGAGRIKQ